MSKDKEEWRPVAGAWGYEVSSLGRVRSWRRGGMKYAQALEPRILKPHVTNYGYQIVGISCGDGKSKNRLVHTLVARAFIGEKPKGLDTCHLNCIKTDNRPCNLAYATRKENMSHTVALRQHAFGERSGPAKLKEAQVREIRRLYAEGVGQRELARRYGVWQRTIRALLTRVTWKHVE